jgi:hypothetical protein
MDFTLAATQTAGTDWIERINGGFGSLSGPSIGEQFIPPPTSLIGRATPTFEGVDQLKTWVEEFLAKPHPALGRKGTVCPFIPGAISAGTLRYSGINLSAVDYQSFKDVFSAYFETFRGLGPAQAPHYRALLIAVHGIDTKSLTKHITEAQVEFRQALLSSKILLGGFHPDNSISSLRNSAFFPFRAPVNTIVYRDMVAQDSAFILKANLPDAAKSEFFKSFPHPRM